MLFMASANILKEIEILCYRADEIFENGVFESILTL